MPRKRIKRWIKNWAVNWVASLLYIIGLSLVIPLWTLVFSPFRVFNLRVVSTVILAGSLVLAAFTLLKGFYGSRSRAYWHLSLATMVPVVLAIIVSLFPVDYFFGVVGAFVSDASAVRPLVDLYLEAHVPRVRSVLIAYAVVGAALLYKSRQSKKR